MKDTKWPTQHVLVDSEGNSWNVQLKIRDNRLFATWEDLQQLVDLNECSITIKDDPKD